MIVKEFARVIILLRLTTDGQSIARPLCNSSATCYLLRTHLTLTVLFDCYDKLCILFTIQRILAMSGVPVCMLHAGIESRQMNVGLRGFQQLLGE